MIDAPPTWIECLKAGMSAEQAAEVRGVSALVEALELLTKARERLDDTPEFCALVAALAAFKGDAQ